MIDICAERTRQLYRGQAAIDYEKTRVDRPQWAREQEAVAEFLKGAFGSVLDVPVGTGRFVELYRSLGLTMIGMDVSEHMMTEARKKDAKADLRIGDILKIPLPDNAVDVSVCIRLLNLITETEMQEALAELCRVTRSRIVLTIRLSEFGGRKARSLTHRQSAFDEVLKFTGRTVQAQRDLRNDGYRLVKLA